MRQRDLFDSATPSASSTAALALLRLAALTGQPVSVNVSQPDSSPEVWREVLSLLDTAHADGLPLFAQVAGRSIGLLYCLHGSVHPLMFHPAFREIAHLPVAEQLVALAEPERRHRIVHDIPDDGFLQIAVLDKAHAMWPTDDGNIDYEPTEEQSVAAIARRTGVPVMQVILDHLVGLDGNGMIYTPFFNYSYGDLGFTYEAHRHPHTRMGLSDAGAHCGVICDGGMPTFMLTHWTRDRSRGPKLPLEHIVHRQTSQTAALYGITVDAKAAQPKPLRPTRPAAPAKKKPAAPKLGAKQPVARPAAMDSAIR